jgi:hypothetical protein
MSWEPWHVQLASPGDGEAVVPDEEVLDGEETPPVEEAPPVGELERHGVDLGDVEATVEELLVLYEERAGS